MKIGQKTFNLSYIQLILESKSFRKISKDYHKTFKDECLAERKKKIATFTSSLLKLGERYRENTHKLVQYMQSSKCKIPWSNLEIDEAWKRASLDLPESNSESEEEESISMVNESQ
eukprot:GHVR01010930.1.p2 GENE.GHVR01010930.1~~GHVR01010930.1.p2  ORF type:complete len:116 (+),score=5.92 GHVR01010930.1:1577-1924(+)